MSTPNPYAAPKAAVTDETIVNRGDFLATGQAVAAGQGWAWIAAAWELYKRQWGLWIGIWLLFVVIFMVASFIPILGGLLTVLFLPVFLAGFAVGSRALDEGSELELGHLFAGFRERTGTLIGVGALYLAATIAVVVVVGLIMGVGIFTMMGGDPEAMAAMGVTMLLAMLVMIALMVPVAMAIWFAAPLVVFNNMGAIDALKASFAGCLKNIVPFLLYGVVLFAFAILASLPIGLGWLVLGPVISISVYTAYRDIYFKRPQ